MSFSKVVFSCGVVTLGVMALSVNPRHTPDSTVNSSNTDVNLLVHVRQDGKPKSEIVVKMELVEDPTKRPLVVVSNMSGFFVVSLPTSWHRGSSSVQVLFSAFDKDENPHHLKSQKMTINTSVPNPTVNLEIMSQPVFNKVVGVSVNASHTPVSTYPVNATLVGYITTNDEKPVKGFKVKIELAEDPECDPLSVVTEEAFFSITLPTSWHRGSSVPVSFSVFDKDGTSLLLKQKNTINTLEILPTVYLELGQTSKSVFKSSASDQVFQKNDGDDGSSKKTAPKKNVSIQCKVQDGANVNLSSGKGLGCHACKGNLHKECYADPLDDGSNHRQTGTCQKLSVPITTADDTFYNACADLR